MSLPIIRKETLFSIEGKNISLTDLRGSTYVGIEILSVESFESKPSSLTRVRRLLNLPPNNIRAHNTRVVVQVDTWKILDRNQWKTDRYQQRVCLYNRLDLADIVPEDLEIPVHSLSVTLEFFRSKGYDFTEDDIYIENFVVYAKETSLGYYGNLSDNVHYNSPRLISEDHQHLIIVNDSKRIDTKENGNEP